MGLAPLGLEISSSRFYLSPSSQSPRYLAASSRQTALMRVALQS